MASTHALSGSDTAWLLAASAMVLLMTPGLALFYGGLVRASNVLNTMLMSFIAMGWIPILWVSFSFSLAFAEDTTSDTNLLIGDFRFSGLIALQGTVWPQTAVPALLYAVFQMTFAIISAAIVSGATVERMRFGAYVSLIILWHILVYVPIGHWAWGVGWLQRWGALDFAGGTVVHLSAAVSALVAAAWLGPRLAYRSGDLQEVKPHNQPFVMMGCALLWFGWSGFNAGSAVAANEVAAQALMATYVAAAAAMIVWVSLERARTGQVTVIGVTSGIVVGLVAITPACGYVSPLSAMAVGGIGACFVHFAFLLAASRRARVDDSLDVFAGHGIGGIIGTILTGVFAEKGGLLYGGGWSLVAKQCVAVLAVAAYAAIVTACICFLMGRFVEIRVAEEDESVGLDKAAHGGNAYDVEAVSRQ